MPKEQVQVQITADVARFNAELKKIAGLLKDIENNKISFSKAQQDAFKLASGLGKAQTELNKAVASSGGLAGNLEKAALVGDSIDANTTSIQASTVAAERLAIALEQANIAGDRIDANPTSIQASAASAGVLAANLAAADGAGSGLGGKIKTIATNAGELALKASVAGTVLAGVLGAGAVKQASDLGEALNKNSVVFGEQAGNIEEWARQMSKMGQSTTTALEGASRFGNLFESFGVNKSQKEIAEMSKQMTELASDMSSFSNVPIAETMQALASGLSGETEPLKRFGIILTDAELRAKALQQGMQIPAGVMDPAIKSLLTYQVILESTKNQQGDFQRTFNSFPNLGRTIQATFTNSFATLGQNILPTLTPILEGFISKIDPLIQSFAPVLQSLAPMLGVFATQLTSLVQTLSPIFATFISAVTPVLALVGEELTNVIRELAPEFTSLIQAVAPLAIIFAKLFTTIAAPVLSGLMRVLTPLAQAFTRLAVIIQPFIETIMGGLMKILLALIPVLEAFITPIIDAFIPVIEILTPLFEELLTTIADLIPTLTPIFQQFGEVFGEILVQLALASADLLPLVIKLFKDFLPALLPLIPSILDLIKAVLPLLPLFLQLANIGLPLVLNALILLTPVIAWLVDLLAKMFSWIAEKIAPAIQDFVDKHGEDIQNLFNGVAGAVKSVVDWLQNLWVKFQELLPVITGFVSRVVESLTGFGTTIWNALSGGFEMIKTNVSNWVDGIVNLFKSIGSGAVDGILGAVKTIAKAINSIIGGFNAVTEIVGIPGLPKIKIGDEVPEFHTGGVVGDGGRMRTIQRKRSDEQLAMLLEGEGVLPQDAMRTWGSEMFQMMRAGDRTGLMKALLADGASKRDVIGLDYDTMFATAKTGDGVGGFLKGLAGDILGAFGIKLPDIGGLFSENTGRMYEFVKKFLFTIVEKVKGLLFGAETFNLTSDATRGAEGYRGAIAAAAGKPGSWRTLVAYLEALGVPHVVTSTFRPFAITASGNRSYHAQNRAVDLAPPGGGVDNTGLGRIFWAFKPVFDLLAELIYAGPQTPFNIKNGAQVAKYAQAIHHNHVHAAAEKGGIVRGSARGKLILAGENNKDEAILPLNDKPRSREIMKQLGFDSHSVTVEGSSFTFNNQASPKHVASIITDHFDRQFAKVAF